MLQLVKRFKGCIHKAWLKDTQITAVMMTVVCLKKSNNAGGLFAILAKAALLLLCNCCYCCSSHLGVVFCNNDVYIMAI